MIERVDGVCGGEPVIAGTRITCAHLHRLRFGLGMDVAKILAEYPHLRLEAIEEAIAYALKHPEILKEEDDDES